jgi:hypothetical protein
VVGDAPNDIACARSADFIDPERGHPLLDNSVSDSDRANPDGMADVAAVGEVLRHAVFVASDDNKSADVTKPSSVYGYELGCVAAVRPHR